MIYLIIFLLVLVGLFLLSRINLLGRKIALYVILLVIAAIMLMPFYMMFVMATHTTTEIYSFPPALWFGSSLVENFKNMIEAVNFPKAFFNSCFVTITYVVLVLFFCSIGGYAFAVYDFPGRKQLFIFPTGWKRFLRSVTGPPSSATAHSSVRRKFQSLPMMN